MAQDFNLNQGAPITGAGTYSSTIASAGPYTLSCNLTLPWAPAGSSQQSSNIQIILKQNSTTLITVGGSSADPTPTQGSIGAVYNLSAAANDVVHVVISSSNAIDSVPNSVKGIINLSQGI